MTQVPENSDANIYESLVAEYANLQAELEPIQARMNEIKKFLRELDYGSHEIAGLKVTIGRNARLDEAKFMELYPPEQFPQYYKHVPDSKKYKEALPGAVVKALQNEGEPRIGIK